MYANCHTIVYRFASDKNRTKRRNREGGANCKKTSGRAGLPNNSPVQIAINHMVSGNPKRQRRK